MENLAQILLIGFSLRGVLLIEVVIAVAHHQTRLRSVQSVHVAVHQVGLDTDRKERIGYRTVEFSDKRRQFGTLLHGENPLAHRTDGCGPLGIQPCGIESHLIEVGDFLLDAALLGLNTGHGRKEVVDADFVVLAQDVERSVARKLGFQRIALLPAARGVLVEIFVRSDRSVEIRQIDGRNFRRVVVLTGCHKQDGR